MAIPEAIIEEVRSRCDIVELIGSSVQLKRAGGSSYKGLCPFHQEKTPSFHVDGARQSYHCFGCGKGGNVFRFFMDRDGLTFPEAVRMLAARVGVVVPEEGEGAGDAKRRSGMRERLIRINETLSSYFCRNLAEHPDAPVAQYLRRRGIPGDIARRFRIGAAPEGWQNGIDLCRREGFGDDELVAAGVACRSEKSGRIFDQFRERLTFTIENEFGKAVGFSARSLEAKPQDGRKYVNTPDTPIFHKGQLLYALPLARKGIAEKKLAILCEGQLDTIAFHRAGFDCAVAPLGTAFTADQARVLKRYTDRIALAFDSDGAGQKAILRAAEILLPLSMELRVIRIPGGKDPDELFATGGAAAVEAAVEASVSWLDVVIASLEGKFRMETPVGRGEAASFLAGYLNLVENRVELESYVRQAAESLRVSEDAVFAELARVRRHERRREEFRPAPAAAEAASAAAPVDAALSTLLDLAVNCEEAARLMGELLPPEALPDTDPVCRAIGCGINAALNGEFEDLPRQLGELLVESPSPEVSRALVEHVEFSDPERAVRDSVAQLGRIRARQRRQEIMERLRRASDDDEKRSLLLEIQKLNKEGRTP